MKREIKAIICKAGICLLALALSMPLAAQNDDNRPQAPSGGPQGGPGGGPQGEFGEPNEDNPEAQEKKKAKKKKVSESKKYNLVTLHGIAVDIVSKQPVAGIQVQSLGNKRYSAMTDETGKFEVKVPDFTTSLYVYSAGYLSQQVAVDVDAPDTEIMIKVISDNYREMYKDETRYTATSSFEAEGRDLVIDNEIANRLSGDIRAISRSAAPGVGASLFIRGINSINANSQPLVIIDGVEQDMQLSRTSLHDGQFNNILGSISPDDIESVQVLKNATALYGSRGSNGVIIIKTKRGHSMATRIDANISVGVSLIPQLPTMMNATQYRNYATELLGTVDEIKDASSSDQISFRFLNDDPDYYYYNMYHNDTDWTDYVYRNGLTQNYSINVQGGDAVGMYNLSVGYVTSESTADYNNYERMNVRFNTDINIISILDTKFDISISRTAIDVFDDGVPEDLETGTITSPTFLALIKSPLVAPYEYNSTVGSFTSLLSDADDLFDQLGDNYSLANPLAILQNGNGENKNRAETTYFNMKVAPTLKIGKDFVLTETVSYNLVRIAQRYYRPYEGVPSYTVDGIGTVTSKVSSMFSKETNFYTDTRLDWDHQYGKHTLSGFLGYRYNVFSYDGSDLSTQYNSSTSDKNPTLATSPYPAVEGDNDIWKNMQAYINVDYNYMNRYFATVSLTAEANSRFGANAGGIDLFGVNWALFPSVQLGWVMTNEKWFPKNNWVNYLRINAGFDISGNDDISNYAAQTSYTVVKYNYRLTGLQLTNIGNDQIKWETTKKWNFGLEANLFDNRLSLGFDYFIHNTSDLLTLMTFSEPVAGINNYWTNGGKLKNTGFEARFSVKPIIAKDWNVEIGATVGHYKNEVTALPDGDYTSSIYGEDNILTSVGNAVAVFYGYETAGVFSTDAEASTAGLNGSDYLYMINSAGQRTNFTAGDVHFVDQNGDGVIDEDDKVIIGDPNPDIYGNIFGSINWKHLTLSFNINYSLGNDVYNYQRSVLNSGSTFYNQQVAETGHWRYEGQVTDLPKLAYGDPMENNRFSDRWIEDGSYLRLKTLTLTYKVPIPGSWTWLQGLSIWGEAQNLLTLTKYTGSDPEFSISNNVMYQGIDCGNLALGRTFTVGVKINL